MKRFDLTFGVNVRGTDRRAQACLPNPRTAAGSQRNSRVPAPG